MDSPGRSDPLSRLGTKNGIVRKCLALLGIMRGKVQDERWPLASTNRPLVFGENLAPQVGLEPTTLRLTAECSTIELLRSMSANVASSVWQCSRSVRFH